MPPHVTELTVRLAETDEFGVVWHGNYPLYFEVARTELARPFQLTAKDLKAANLFPPVVELSLSCKLPAKNDDRLAIHTTVDPIDSASITLRYRILRDADLIATGWTKQVLVNEKGFLLYQIPADLDARLKRLAAAHPS